MTDYSGCVFDGAYEMRAPALVEASAGTGKTYQIQNAYLRLVVAEGCRVDRILVVTFTEAATRELRDRLRRILADFDAFLSERPLKKESDRSRFEQVKQLEVRNHEADGVTPEEARKVRVKLALMNFDRAAISTIHGFCSRVLDRYAFECGHDPEAELLPEDRELIRERCRDWWRKHAYADAAEAAAIPFEDPDELQGIVSDALARPDARLLPEMPRESEMAGLMHELRTTAADFLRSRASDGPHASLAPNPPAQELESLFEDLAGRSEVPDSDRIIACYRMSRNAEWSCADMDPPANAQTLREACAVIAFPEDFDFRKKCSWEGGDIRRGNDGELIRVEGLLRALPDLCRGLDAWMNGIPECAWKQSRGTPTRNVAAFREAMEQFIATAADPGSRGEAKAFLRHVCSLKSIQDDHLFAPRIDLSHVSASVAAVLDRSRLLILAKKVGTATELVATVRAHLRERRLLTYDQMLLGVRDALEDGDRGTRLRTVLRADFDAALIDEFQDTDPVQYRIFSRIFHDDPKPGPAEEPKPLLFVGDPKQAIYGFRSGDIFTYYGAQKTMPVGRKHALGKNYRSEPNLVHAVNELFSDDAGGRSFLNEHIRYAPVGVEGLPEDEWLTLGRRTDEKPLKIWQYETSGSGKKVPAKDSPFAKHVVARIAGEIVQLLAAEAKVKRGNAPLKPSDIAVLVAAHDEAAAIQKELAERKVHAVVQKTGNVFDTDEAADLCCLMEAMLAPGSAAAVRAAVCREILPCSREELLGFQAEMPGEEALPAAGAAPVPASGRTLDEWMEIFERAGAMWKRRSFTSAFGTIERRLGLRGHVIGLDSGERRLTHLLHLADLAHREARQRKLGPESLLRWVTLQREAGSREEREDFANRLCSDENAVQIMTVFKSKGLQFPVVFVPTLWRKSAKPRQGGRKNDFLSYHDDDGEMILNLDKDDERAKQMEDREKLEENTRLVYVAVTRAASRVYLVSVTTGDPETYALQRLLARFDSGAPPQHIEWTRFDAESLPEVAATCWAPERGEPGAEKRLGDPRVDTMHGQASFSSLVRVDEGLLPPSGRDLDRDDEESPEAEPARADIFAIPGGQRTGNCWHDLLEELDFMAGDEGVRVAVGAVLDKTGICRDPVEEIETQKRAVVLEMIRQVLSAPIHTETSDFSLNHIAMTVRRSELPFNFSLKQQGPPVTLRDLHAALDRTWHTPARDAAFLADLAGQETNLPLGYMTGFIDLLFLHEGRFYIADWKSNRLNGKPAGFDTPGLAHEMRRHGYYLQYMIYAVAVHSFLRRKLAGYAFESHFGGVLYFFLRGIDGKTQRGIFHDPLSAGLVDALSRVFARGTEGGVP